MMTYEEFLDRYEINSKKDFIASGGFSLVYRALDKKTKKYKVVKKALADGRAEKYRLSKEVDYVRECGAHENIANYIYSFSDKNPTGITDYAIMEYYEKGDLEKIVEETQLSLKDKKDILEGILNGLAHIHRFGTHKDLKPKNILMSQKGEHWIPKISDFGLARMVKIDHSMITNTGKEKTLSYSSPEIVQDASHHKKNTDLWSFGATAYYLMTGEAPFKSDKAGSDKEAEIRRKIINGELPEAIKHIPAPYQNLIRGCLWVNIDERIESASEALKILKNHAVWSPPSLDHQIGIDPDVTGGKLLKQPKIELPTVIEPLPWWRQKVFIISLLFILFLGMIRGLYSLNSHSSSIIAATNDLDKKTLEKQEENSKSSDDKKTTPIKEIGENIITDVPSPNLVNGSSKEKISNDNSTIVKGGKTTTTSSKEEDTQDDFDPETPPPVPPISLEGYMVYYRGCKNSTNISLKSPLTPVCKNGLLGFLDKKGREIIPCIYEGLYGTNFSPKGYAILKKNGRWGVIDTTEKTLINFIHQKPNKAKEAYLASNND